MLLLLFGAFIGFLLMSTLFVAFIWEAYRDTAQHPQKGKRNFLILIGMSVLIVFIIFAYTGNFINLSSKPSIDLFSIEFSTFESK